MLNKIIWDRTKPLEPSASSAEVWRLKTLEIEKEFLLAVEYSKKLDAFSIKRKIVSDFEGNVTRIQSENQELFSSQNLEEVKNCPICQTASNHNAIETTIYGAHYINCSQCTHRYVGKRPTTEALKKFYAENDQYQATYADEALLKERIASVVQPKLDWVIKTYKNQYNKQPPKSILDVGAGSGHFVAACRQAGFQADGIELSKSGIGFAKKNFSIDLKYLDFLKQKSEISTYDVITLWGCLEHVSDPMSFLKVAHEKLSSRGLLVVEVPRWFSLSTFIQKEIPEKVIRHLVPSAHIHMFSDSSIATSFILSDFSPVGAWYFGMDVYETALLLSARYGTSKEKFDLSFIAPHIGPLQVLCDQNHLSDFLVFAGTPKRPKN